MSIIIAIVCTKDRPDDLTSLLTSLRVQKRKFDKVIIVDGSDEPINHVTEHFTDLNLEYTHVSPPGLTKQRNVGISLLPQDYNWVGFLDDDLVLEEDCVSNLNQFIEKNNDVKGIGLRINNQSILRPSIYRTIFFTDIGNGGVVTKSGHASAIRPVTEDQDVNWLYGGATFWNKEIISNYSFDEWYSGIGYLEDVDFSYNVSRSHRLMLCSSARCFHYSHPVSKNKLYRLGAWHFVAWWYFISKWKEFNKLTVLWSMFGVFISNFGHGLLLPRTNRLRSALGNLAAWKVIATGNVRGFKGFQK
jgi:GT2 family glycosyltransferase